MREWPDPPAFGASRRPNGRTSHCACTIASPNPRKADRHRWREAFAELLRVYGVEGRESARVTGLASRSPRVTRNVLLEHAVHALGGDAVLRHVALQLQRLVRSNKPW